MISDQSKKIRVRLILSSGQHSDGTADAATVPNNQQPSGDTQGTAAAQVERLPEQMDLARSRLENKPIIIERLGKVYTGITYLQKAGKTLGDVSSP